MRILISKKQYNILKENMSNHVTVYHGSTKKISKFVDDFVGGKDATDQSGPGIYFTDTLSEAQHYGEYVYKAELDTSGFVSDEDESSEDYIEDLVSLIKMAPGWEDSARNFSEDPEDGVYDAAYMAVENNDDVANSFLQVWIDFYRYRPIDYVRNMVKLGYNGLIITNENAGLASAVHYIIYNPSIIKI